MITVFNTTIRHKVIHLVMLICVFVLILAGGALFGFINYMFRSSMAQQMLADASMMSDNCNIALAFQNRDDVERTLSSLKSKPSIIFAGVYSDDDELFAAYFSAVADQTVTPTLLKEDGHCFEAGFLTTFKGIILDGERIGTLVVCSDMKPFYSFVRKVLVATFCILIVALWLAYGLSARFQYIISGPILKLAAAAKNISENKDFSVRVEEAGDDELGQLIVSFNEMLQQIQQKDNALLEANKSLRQEIRQRKHTEEVLRESEAKPRESNEELEDFAYVSPHDLREPLRKITSFGILLADSLQDRIDDDQRENLEFVLEGTNRMKRMIEGLLEYSQVRTTSAGFDTTDMNDLVQSVIDSLPADTIAENTARIEVCRPLHRVNCDEAQIKQLMWHLISNALKYKKSGTIAEIVISSTLQDDGKVRIEVQDNGIGIKSEHFKNIFGIFKRLHLPTEYDGAGIGLALCRRIIRRHGGNIGVSSTYGQGSTFWFTLPAAESGENDVVVVSSSRKESM